MPKALAAAAICALAIVSLRAATAPPALYPARDVDTTLGRVNDVAFSSDGRLLAAGGARGFGVWDAQTGNEIRKDVAAGAVQRVALGAQGTLLALGGADGRVRVVDLRSGSVKDGAKHNKPVTAVAFSADGRTGASGDAEGNIMLWDPDRGPIAPLKDPNQKKDIVVLAFSGNQLLSASTDLQVVTWDVSGKRALRRGTLQSSVRGRTVVANSGAVDPAGTKLVLGAQLVSEQRGGVLAGRDQLARPSDLRRDNVLVPYEVMSGISSASVVTADFEPERIALGPGACYAFFTSFFRNQARLHVWGLKEQGDDLTRLELQGRATAVALEPGSHVAAVGYETGRVQTWNVSGATASDCDAYSKPTAVQQVAASISLGSETQPLIKGGAGTRVAVLRFDATGVDAGLGDAVADMIAGELANSPQVTVIERSAIDRILRELEIQRSGLTAADAVKIGKGLNAKTVLLGGVRRFGDSTYVVTTRAVDVETQQVQGSRDVTCENCKESDLPRAVAALRRTIVP